MINYLIIFVVLLVFKLLITFLYYCTFFFFFFLRGRPKRERGSRNIDSFCKIQSIGRYKDFLHPSTKRRKITSGLCQTMCYYVTLSTSVLEKQAPEVS